MGIIPLLDDPHGIHDPLQTLREGQGIQHGEDQHGDLQNEGDLQNGLLQRIDQAAGGGVVFHHVYTAHHAAVEYDGGGGLGTDHTVMVLQGEYIIVAGGFHHLRQQNARTQAFTGAVVNGDACLVRDDEAGYLHAAHLGDGLGNGGMADDLQLGDIIGGNEAFFHHGCLLALGEHFLGGSGTVNIQNDQHHRCDHDIGHGIAELGAAVASEIHGRHFLK